MRVRILNSSGDPLQTTIVDDETGIALKDATGVLVFPFDTTSKEIRAEITVRVTLIDVMAEGHLVAHCPNCNQKLKILDYADMLKYLPKGAKLEIKDDTITAYWDKDANIEWKQTDNPRIEIGEEKLTAQIHKEEFINWLRGTPETYRDWQDPKWEAIHQVHRQGRDNPSTYELPKNAHNVTSHYDETTGIMNITWDE